MLAERAYRWLRAILKIGAICPVAPCYLEQIAYAVHDSANWSVTVHAPRGTGPMPTGKDAVT